MTKFYKTHLMYVCDTCKFAHYHPLSYCPRCPGRLHRTAVPHPDRFETEADIVAHLKTQGIEYIGEYPKVPKDEQQRISQARGVITAEKKIAEVRLQMLETDDAEQIGRLKKSEAYWTRLREEYKAGTHE